MKKKSLWRRVIKPFASLKLAVMVLLSMAVMTAIGTFVEAHYNDAKMAQELVYHSWWSYSIFALMSFNLTAVILDRYPWKRHHISFISAHIGILALVLGSVLTRYFGIDGSLSFEIGASESKVTVNNTDLTVYGSMDGRDYRKIFDQEVFFLKSPPTPEDPFVIPLSSGEIRITEFHPYSFVEDKVIAKEGGVPAVRFQLSNQNVQQTEWIIANKKEGFDVLELGPARVILSLKDDYNYSSGNVLFLYPISQEQLGYKVFSDRKKGLLTQGKLTAGDRVPLGWMNLELRLLKYLKEARQDFRFTPTPRSTEKTISALKFYYNDQEHWMGANSMVRFFADSEMYVMTFGNRQLPLDFKLALKDFRVGRYQGTMRAASYESLVTIPETGEEVLISMNEPLKYKGFTFYQASFQEDDMGRPTASVLSVNYDPGRWIKYLGSLLLVFGSAHLFYRRWKQQKRQIKHV